MSGHGKIDRDQAAPAQCTGKGRGKSGGKTKAGVTGSRHQMVYTYASIPGDTRSGAHTLSKILRNHTLSSILNYIFRQLVFRVLLSKTHCKIH